MQRVKSTPDLLFKSAAKDVKSLAVWRFGESGGLDDEDTEATLFVRSFEFCEDPNFWQEHNVQLLEPGRYIWLLKALYGLLILFPQQQHLMHVKSQTQLHYSSSTKEVQRPEEPKKTSSGVPPNLSRPRSSRRDPGHFEL